jgi:hypothetical protein
MVRPKYASNGKTWSEIEAAMQDTSTMIRAGFATPLHEGIELANTLFVDDENRRPYRIIVVLIDGEPRGCGLGFRRMLIVQIIKNSWRVYATSTHQTYNLFNYSS